MGAGREWGDGEGEGRQGVGWVMADGLMGGVCRD